MLLAACGDEASSIAISTQPVNKPKISITPPDEVNLRPVSWTVINSNNLNEKIAELTAKNQPLVLFALTAEGYKNLSLNISDIRALLQQQQQIIVAYQSYYENK
jgi:hypothetical protein